MLLVKPHDWGRHVVFSGPKSQRLPTQDIFTSGEAIPEVDITWQEADFSKADRLFGSIWPLVAAHRHQDLPPPENRRLGRSLNWWYLANTLFYSNARILMVVTAIESILSVDIRDNTRKFARRLNSTELWSRPIIFRPLCRQDQPS